MPEPEANLVIHIGGYITCHGSMVSAQTEFVVLRVRQFCVGGGISKDCEVALILGEGPTKFKYERDRVSDLSEQDLGGNSSSKRVA